MSEQIRNSISELFKESSNYSTKDVLVDVSENAKSLFEYKDSKSISFDDFPKKIVKEWKQFTHLSGVNPLCITRGTVSLEIGSKQVLTPAFLTPIVLKLNRVDKRYELELLEDEEFINPFLKHELSSLLPDQTIPQKEGLGAWLIEHNLNYNEGSRFIGNFHHHRFQLIKELEELLKLDRYSSGLNELFGEGQQAGLSLDLTYKNLLPADSDHMRVFESVNAKNTVIQGPPGTGKSQVLSNLISKLLNTDKTVVVVSEKRSALEIIPKKLSPYALDRLCFIATSDRMTGSFLDQLQANWDYFDQLDLREPLNLNLSKQHEDRLQFTLDLLSKEDMVGGLNVYDFLSLSEKCPNKQGYSSEVPKVNEILERKSALEAFYKNGIHKVISSLKLSTIQSEGFDQIDREIQSDLSRLKSIQKNFEVNSFSSLAELMKRSAICQVFENDQYRKFGKILKPNSRDQKRFLKLRREYFILLEKQNGKTNHWKIVPDEDEVHSLIQQFESGGFLSKRRAGKRWKQLSHIDVNQALSTLHHRREEIGINNKLSQYLIKFYDLGLENVQTELEVIHQTITHIDDQTWDEYHELTPSDRAKLTAHHKDLNELYSSLRRPLKLRDEDDIESTLQSISKCLPELIAKKQFLSSCSSELLRSLGAVNSYEELLELTLNSHLIRFKEQLPELADYRISELSTNVEEVLRVQDEDSEIFASEIEYSVYKRFKAYHDLLNTPARKLSEEQKELKKTLRKGKSILVKEFAKTRNHPSLRDLFHSEAKPWIKLLKPVWLSNPTQIGRCFPLEEKLFDVVVFDEASQIPLQNALGAIHRSERIAIAGDDQQMGPTSYFTRRESIPVDLLHQASFHFPKVKLQHHYRSVHPDLIAFSNRHFYDNELRVYPGVPNEEAPIKHHCIEDGVFENRVNKKEAEKVARHISSLLSNNESIGVVAFSDEQLNCIWEELTTRDQELITEMTDESRGFFRSLENVQGDECDRLIISFGYGRNTKGEFNMRFGPMNTLNGRKRLNVLLTRAIRSIDFFCSIESKDFKMSDNESVNLLKKWIAFSEGYSNPASISLPFDLEAKIQGNTLEVKAAHRSMSQARELSTFHRALQARDWKLIYS